MSQISIEDAQARFGDLMDQVLDEREPVMITRGRGEPVALIAAGELEAMMTTIHLLRSWTNAERVHAALERAKVEDKSVGT